MAASGDTLRNLLLVGLGVYSLTRDRIGAIASDAADRGGMREDEAGAVVDAMARRAQNERDLLTELVREQMVVTTRTLGVVLRNDLDAVTQRVKRLEQMIDK